MNTNNPRYWFRAKRYGLGWGLPLAWQGWVFLLAWIVTVLVGHRLLVLGEKVFALDLHGRHDHSVISRLLLERGALRATVE
jgi:hypothetical protein